MIENDANVMIVFNVHKNSLNDIIVFNIHENDMTCQNSMLSHVDLALIYKATCMVIERSSLMLLFAWKIMLEITWDSIEMIFNICVCLSALAYKVQSSSSHQFSSLKLCYKSKDESHFTFENITWHREH